MKQLKGTDSGTDRQTDTQIDRQTEAKKGAIEWRDRHDRIVDMTSTV